MTHRVVLPAVLLLLVLAACVTPTSIASDSDTRAYDTYPTIAINPALPALDGPAEVTITALRIDPPEQTTTTTLPSGLWDLPYAPDGLSNCDEMNWYRVQWGLPDRFAALGWRESNCRNEDSVRTFCCHGYWQLYVSLHLSDWRLILPYHTVR